jgi:hypothetical protein
VILTSLCNTCFSSFHVTVEPEDVHLLQGLRDDDGLCACPRLCGGKINLGKMPVADLVNHPAVKPPLSVTARELYKAVQGAGLPDEVPTSVESLFAILKTYRIVNAKMVKDGRIIYLNELTLDNGLIVHLSAGRLGAAVVKITKEA